MLYTFFAVVILVMGIIIFRQRRRIPIQPFAFLDMIVAGIASITDRELDRVTSNLRPIKDGEEVMGSISLELRKTWAFVLRLRKERDKEMFAKYEKNPLDLDPREVTDLLSRTNMLQDKAQAVEKFFWNAVCAELELFGMGSIGIRANWEIVVTDPLCKECGVRHPKDENMGLDLGELLMAFSGGKDIAEM
jgi:hypothetical protein